MAEQHLRSHHWETLDRNDEQRLLSAATTENGVNKLDILLGGIVLFLVCLCLPSFLKRRRWRREQLEAYQQSRRSSDSNNNNIQAPSSEQSLTPQQAKKKEAARLSSIENWLVSRKILSHDDLCSKCVTAGEKKTKAKSSSSSKKDHSSNRSLGRKETAETADSAASSPAEEDDVASEQGNECPICFDEFHVGDVASWSPESTCTHVFHHACIKQWLLKNSGCPFCRATFLPVDRLSRQQRGFKETSVLVHAHKQRSKDCYYCSEHGIVKLPPVNKLRTVGKMSRDEIERAQTRARDVPCKQALIALRGQTDPQQEDVENETDESSSGQVEDSVTAASTADEFEIIASSSLSSLPNDPSNLSAGSAAAASSFVASTHLDIEEGVDNNGDDTTSSPAAAPSVSSTTPTTADDIESAATSSPRAPDATGDASR